MRFQAFIEEAAFDPNKRPINPNKGRAVSEKRLLELIQGDYSVAFQKYQKGFRLWRGIRDNFGFKVFTKSARKPRVSANTQNYYTLLIDEILPEWKYFPKRSMSLICTNKETSAEAYGGGWAFVVLPKNGSKIAICPENDFWNSFERDISLAHINKGVYELAKLQGIELSNDNAQELVTDLQRVTMKIKSKDMDALPFSAQRAISYFATSRYKNAYEIYTHILSPQRFKLETIENFDLKFTPNSMGSQYAKEVWTDGDCLLVNTANLAYLNGVKFKSARELAKEL